MKRGNGTVHDACEALARALGVAVDALDDALGGPTPERLWGDLTAAGRAVVGNLLALGGRAAPAWVVALAADELGEGGAASAQATTEADQALADLWERGLLARHRVDGDAFVPDGLARAWLPLAQAHEAGHEPASRARAHPLDDHVIGCLLALVMQAPVPVTREGRPHRRSLAGLAGRLAPLVPPEVVSLALDALAHLGVLRREAEGLSVDRDRARAWATRPPAERRTDLLGAGGGFEDAALLLRQLQDIDPRRPVSAARARRSWARAWLAHAGTPGGDPADHAAEVRRRAEAAADSLVVAGLADLDPTEGIVLTPAGRAHPAAVRIDAPAGFHVGPDLSVLVPRGLPLDVHLTVAEVSDLVAADVVARYHLARERLLTALDQGLDRAELEAFLVRRAEPALPETARAEVERWCARFGEVTGTQGIALCCHVPERREEFDAVVRASGVRVRPLAPGVAVVDPSEADELFARLSAAGFATRRRVEAPAVESAEAGEPVRGSSAAEPGPDWERLPGWGALDPGLAGLEASPPPGELSRRLKRKYEREFGRRTLAALDALHPDELLALEEQGLVRDYLSGEADVPSAAPEVRLADYAGPSLVPVAADRARAVLRLAMRAGARCQVAHAARPGRLTRLVLEPLSLEEVGRDWYLRARTSTSGEERMIALARLQALRVLSVAEGRETGRRDGSR